ncbi:MAG TPA: hypothetical protein VNO35_15350 [Steroidobacteraceae bacterium]|nr:hypothetical protein [Steroidobacteraceae bacterium]
MANSHAAARRPFSPTALLMAGSSARHRGNAAGSAGQPKGAIHDSLPSRAHAGRAARDRRRD